jgi:hypothetical protein
MKGAGQWLEGLAPVARAGGPLGVRVIRTRTGWQLAGHIGRCEPFWLRKAVLARSVPTTTYGFRPSMTRYQRLAFTRPYGAWVYALTTRQGLQG